MSGLKAHRFIFYHKKLNIIDFLYKKENNVYALAKAMSVRNLPDIKQNYRCIGITREGEKMNSKTKTITYGAMIAAVYVVLTLIANAFGLANYAIQVRFSEALTVLPFFTPVAIPGLFIGCIISNILTGCMPLDVVFGSIATLIGALGTYVISLKVKNRSVAKILAPIPPIVSNTLIVPFILAYVYKFEGSIPYFMLTVGIGELISAGVFGLMLITALSVRSDRIFQEQN